MPRGYFVCIYIAGYFVRKFDWQSLYLLMLRQAFYAILIWQGYFCLFPLFLNHMRDTILKERRKQIC